MSYCARTIETDDIQCSHARKELAVKFHVFRDLHCQRLHQQVLQPLRSHAGQHRRIQEMGRPFLPPAAALLAALLNSLHRNHHSILVAFGLSGKLWVWWCDDSLVLFLLSAMDNLQERALHIRKVLLNLPKTTLIVMRYLFAFLNQWVSLRAPWPCCRTSYKHAKWQNQPWYCFMWSVQRFKVQSAQ